MSRKITKEEIDKLKKWNQKNNTYVSIEAYQDILDWIPNKIPDMDFATINLIGKDIEGTNYGEGTISRF